MTTGFVKDHSTEAIGQNNRHLPGFHIVGPQH